MPSVPPDWPAYVDPPDARYRGPIPPRTNRRHLAILQAQGGRCSVLDWGCGTGEYRRPVLALGHRYVAFDLDGSGADVRGDAHAIPFRSACFDHVITNAVLEHVADPIAALREVARVLRPGGRFSGSAAFLEPHHAHSYFHLSPDGLMHVLTQAGFVVDGLWPQEHWLVLDALAEMHGPVTLPTRLALRVLSRVERALRARHLHPRDIASGQWLRRRGDAELRDERLAVAGQVDFLARRL